MISHTFQQIMMGRNNEGLVSYVLTIRFCAIPQQIEKAIVNLKKIASWKRKNGLFPTFLLFMHRNK